MPSEPHPPAQRLHPSSLLFGIGSAARNLILPAVFLLFASSSGGYEPWLMLVLFVPVTAGTLVRYASYRYRLGPEDLVIRDGILTRNERHIPYARIQNIDLIQNPLQRMLGVAVVRIETGSGGKPEAEIKVLSLAAVSEMRSRVFPDGAGPEVLRNAGPDGAGARGDGTGAVAEGRPPNATGAGAAVSLLRLRVRDLFVLGIISNRGMVVVAAALGLLSQTGLFEQNFDEWSAADLEQLRWLPSAMSTTRPLGIALMVVAALVVLLALMRVLSVAWAVAKFYGFSLVQRGDDLRAEYGLLTRVTATLPSHRIQLLSTHRSRLHRWFGRQSVQVETAGGGGAEGEGETSRRQWLAPVIPEPETEGLIARVLPGIDLGAAEWQPIEARAWKRVFKRGLWWVIPLVAVAGFLWRPWGFLVAVPALALAFHHSRAWVAATGYALLPGAILYRSGWWGQRMSVVRFSKIQALALSQSPFDRRHAMSTLSVDTAGAGMAGHRVDIPYLATETAGDIARRLYAESSRTAFRW